jgi:hypothetical protein
MKKRFLALLLAVSMAVSMLAMPAAALGSASNTAVQTAFDLLEPDGWKPGCGQQDDLARGAVVGIGVDRVAIHACELPDRTGEIGAVHVEKVLIKCLQILKSLDNFLTTELLRLLKRSEIS